MYIIVEGPYWCVFHRFPSATHTPVCMNVPYALGEKFPTQPSVNTHTHTKKKLETVHYNTTESP